MMEDEAARLLDLLQAHGQQFLNSFDLSHPPRKRQRIEESPEELESEDFEEWRGFSNAAVESYASEEDNDDDDTPYEYDDGFTASSSAKMPDVVVFSDPRPKPSEQFSKAQKKAFMSSKVAKVTSTTEADGIPHQDEDDIQNDNEDISNAQNDALLHRLVHTKLLSGSLNPELNLTHAQRDKALSGRVLELAGKTKLGKGEVAIRAAERNKASKRVREGLSRKKNEREKQELEEAKNLGNYHPTLKKLFDTSSSGSSDRQRRVRGIGMGVGKFSGGTLKLSREEINSVTGRGVHGTARRGHKTSRGRR